MDNTAERIKRFIACMTVDGQFIVPAPMMEWLTNNGFFTAPASAGHHGNTEGGLYEHSEAVMNVLVYITRKQNLVWKNPLSPYIVGMFHDLCKIDQYRVDNHVPYTVGEPTRWEYNPDTSLKGHGEKSVMLLSQFFTLTEEEIMCIVYHMGAFTDKTEWAFYSRAVHNFPNVLWTHSADMVASQVYNT